MDEASIDQLIGSITDELAAVEHERWSHWQRFVHEQASRLPDGSLLLPAELVERWERQIETSFEELTEKEKESDREQVRRYLPIIVQALARS
ncbi:hypothetical protein NKJ16_08760 [Mesorhizobium sp. M0179]|uniref:hypothetical protein n=1 Tax=unclassified Mesorhizobium TaxID=325217 RepID=UPI0003CE4B61|nr:hypothetical protein [Mesorhizobium sp. LNHC221B00]ESY82164.1 hypothetical protein X740_05175 [Mesorhizobium sp. LNHC221B00]